MARQRGGDVQLYGMYVLMIIGFLAMLAVIIGVIVKKTEHYGSESEAPVATIDYVSTPGSPSIIQPPGSKYPYGIGTEISVTINGKYVPNSNNPPTDWDAWADFTLNYPNGKTVHATQPIPLQSGGQSINLIQWTSTGSNTAGPTSITYSFKAQPKGYSEVYSSRVGTLGPFRYQS